MEGPYCGQRGALISNCDTIQWHRASPNISPTGNGGPEGPDQMKTKAHRRVWLLVADAVLFLLPTIVRAFASGPLVVLAVASVAHAQQTREYMNSQHKIAISFPAPWELHPPVRNEIWLAYGNLRNVPAGCFVRASVVPNLRLVKPDDYFAQIDEKAFVKLNSISQPDIRVHLYDFSYLGGRKARRVIYSGTDDGAKIANLVHQTLDNDHILTVTCFVDAQSFQLVFNELSAIPDSFRFLK